MDELMQKALTDIALSGRQGILLPQLWEKSSENQNFNACVAIMVWNWLVLSPSVLIFDTENNQRSIHDCVQLDLTSGYAIDCMGISWRVKLVATESVRRLALGLEDPSYVLSETLYDILEIVGQSGEKGILSDQLTDKVGVNETKLAWHQIKKLVVDGLVVKERINHRGSLNRVILARFTHSVVEEPDSWMQIKIKQLGEIIRASDCGRVSCDAAREQLQLVDSEQWREFNQQLRRAKGKHIERIKAMLSSRFEFFFQFKEEGDVNSDNDTQTEVEESRQDSDNFESALVNELGQKQQLYRFIMDSGEKGVTIQEARSCLSLRNKEAERYFKYFEDNKFIIRKRESQGKLQFSRFLLPPSKLVNSSYSLQQQTPSRQKREEIIIKSVNKYGIIDHRSLTRIVREEEEQSGSEYILDTKTLRKIARDLQTRGRVKLFKIAVPMNTGKKQIVDLVSRLNITPSTPEFQLAVSQLCIQKRSVSRPQTKIVPASEVAHLSTRSDQIQFGVDNVEDTNDDEITKAQARQDQMLSLFNFVTGKVARARLFHEFLWSSVYGIDLSQSTSQSLATGTQVSTQTHTNPPVSSFYVSQVMAKMPVELFARVIGMRGELTPSECVQLGFAIQNHLAFSSLPDNLKYKLHTKATTSRSMSQLIDSLTKFGLITKVATVVRPVHMDSLSRDEDNEVPMRLERCIRVVGTNVIACLYDIADVKKYWSSLQELCNSISKRSFSDWLQEQHARNRSNTALQSLNLFRPLGFHTSTSLSLDVLSGISDFVKDPIDTNSLASTQREPVFSTENQPKVFMQELRSIGHTLVWKETSRANLNFSGFDAKVSQFFELEEEDVEDKSEEETDVESGDKKRKRRASLGDVKRRKTKAEKVWNADAEQQLVTFFMHQIKNWLNKGTLTEYLVSHFRVPCLHPTDIQKEQLIRILTSIPANFSPLSQTILIPEESCIEHLHTLLKRADVANALWHVLQQHEIQEISWDTSNYFTAGSETAIVLNKLKQILIWSWIEDKEEIHQVTSEFIHNILQSFESHFVLKALSVLWCCRWISVRTKRDKRSLCPKTNWTEQDPSLSAYMQSWRAEVIQAFFEMTGMPFSLSTPILDFFRNDLGLCAHNSVLQDIPNLSSRSFDWLVLRGTIATALRARETPGGIQLESLTDSDQNISSSQLHYILGQIVEDSPMQAAANVQNMSSVSLFDNVHTSLKSDVNRDCLSSHNPMEQLAEDVTVNAISRNTILNESNYLHQYHQLLSYQSLSKHNLFHAADHAEDLLFHASQAQKWLPICLEPLDDSWVCATKSCVLFPAFCYDKNGRLVMPLVARLALILLEAMKQTPSLSFSALYGICKNVLSRGELSFFLVRLVSARLCRKTNYTLQASAQPLFAVQLETQDFPEALPSNATLHVSSTQPSTETFSIQSASRATPSSQDHSRLQSQQGTDLQLEASSMPVDHNLQSDSCYMLEDKAIHRIVNAVVHLRHSETLLQVEDEIEHAIVYLMCGYEID